jgi:hypothetical protein
VPFVNRSQASAWSTAVLAIQAKARPDKLKKDVKVEIVEKDGKLIEINLKK